MDKNTACPVCGGTCALFDVVDFNKSCEEARGRFLSLSGSAVYYAQCTACSFCFAPELHAWNPDQFEQKIYNAGYAAVDPDYAETRPRNNAAMLTTVFGNQTGFKRHLDYGGGHGRLAELLREKHWNSCTYDPYVNRNTAIAELGQFELITAFEVFEHVPDVQNLMKNLHLLMADDGMIIFSTLLSDGHIKPQHRLTWWYASPRNGHISLYSRKSLDLLGRNFGLRLASFSDGLHLFLKEVPEWAKHIIQPA